MTTKPETLTEREMLIYWLLRAYQSGHREGWEAGPSSSETMQGLCDVLANLGYDPNLSVEAKQLLGHKPIYFTRTPATAEVDEARSVLGRIVVELLQEHFAEARELAMQVQVDFSSGKPAARLTTSQPAAEREK